MSDMNHKLKVDNKELKDLAEEIGNLRYDALGELLGLLAIKLGKDADKDRLRGRKQLSGKLMDAHSELYSSSFYVLEAWEICKEKM